MHTTPRPCHRLHRGPGERWSPRRVVEERPVVPSASRMTPGWWMVKTEEDPVCVSSAENNSKSPCGPVLRETYRTNAHLVRLHQLQGEWASLQQNGSLASDPTLNTLEEVLKEALELRELEDVKICLPEPTMEASDPVEEALELKICSPDPSTETPDQVEDAHKITFEFTIPPVSAFPPSTPAVQSETRVTEEYNEEEEEEEEDENCFYDEVTGQWFEYADNNEGYEEEDEEYEEEYEEEEEEEDQERKQPPLLFAEAVSLDKTSNPGVPFCFAAPASLLPPAPFVPSSSSSPSSTEAHSASPEENPPEDGGAAVVAELSVGCMAQLAKATLKEGGGPIRPSLEAVRGDLDSCSSSSSSSSNNEDDDDDDEDDKEKRENSQTPPPVVLAAPIFQFVGTHESIPPLNPTAPPAVTLSSVKDPFGAGAASSPNTNTGEGTPRFGVMQTLGSDTSKSAPASSVSVPFGFTSTAAREGVGFTFASLDPLTSSKK